MARSSVWTVPRAPATHARMIHSSASDWLSAPRKRVLFFGMSGLGKKPATSKPSGIEDMIRTAKNG